MSAPDLRAALMSEDEIAHGEAIRGGNSLDPRARDKMGRCAYCNDVWPCRTQRGIDRLLALIDAQPRRFRELDEIEWSRPGLTPAAGRGLPRGDPAGADGVSAMP